ncbi:cytochrome P450 [Coniella lustricola]|uniref:Cytochrome P450 n=1 Tax=Coniella lustricola TaxID=2025994 RepID=A0A2T3AKH8_9PEZI|nr:cytochrome P450 [Coniella lustricola]
MGGSCCIYINPVADPPACTDVLKRCRSEFQKNPVQYNLLDMYGVNLVTTNGKLWERHRRITTPPFNESVSETVWDESARQADAARRSWMEQSAAEEATVPVSGGGVRTTQHDTTGIAFNVLSAAGFGIQFSFDDVVRKRAGNKAGKREGGGDDTDRSNVAKNDHTDHVMVRYRDALTLLLAHVGELILVTMLHQIWWPKFAMWGIMRAVADAKDEYGLALQRMIKEARQAVEEEDVAFADQQEKEAKAKKKAASLMHSLIKASDQSDSEEGNATVERGQGGVSPGLSDEEVAGNLFVFNIAGHDTTASALNFAITLLAAEPKWQDWLAQEIDTVTSEDQSGLKYAAVFPKLHRCLAVMYETLRLFGPVPNTPRWTAQSYHTLTIEGKEYLIPPDTEIRLDLAALHHDRQTWGEDAEAFRPDRWIPNSTSSTSATTTTTTTPATLSNKSEDVDNQPISPKNTIASAASGPSNGSFDWQSESLIAPVSGTFLPWTGGPRVCPGKKFSQVEFTSAMLRFFKGGARVRVVQEDRETEGEARARASRIVHDPLVSITLRMKNAEKIGLQWYVKSE